MKAEVAGIKIGEEEPTLLTGCLFYWSQDLVEDLEEGEFDPKKAEELINEQETLSDETEINCAIDIVGQSETAMKKYIDFTSEHFDGPIFIDSAQPSVSIAAQRYANEIGLTERVIYNSIAPWMKDDDRNELKKLNVKSVVLFTATLRESDSLGTEDKIELLEGGGGNPGLIEVGKKIGADNLLVDVLSSNFEMMTEAWKTCLDIKERFSLPAGVGTGNIVTTWGPTENPELPTSISYESSINAVSSIFGADFNLYGPIERCSNVFPAVRIAEVAKSEIKEKL